MRKGYIEIKMEIEIKINKSENTLNKIGLVILRYRSYLDLREDGLPVVDYKGRCF